MSNTFDETIEDFSSNENYQQILDIPGEPQSHSQLYHLDKIRKGRYVVIQRQRLGPYLDLAEVYIYEPILP